MSGHILVHCGKNFLETKIRYPEIQGSMVVTGTFCFLPGSQDIQGFGTRSGGEEPIAGSVLLHDPIHPYSRDKSKGTGLGQLPGADMDTELLGGMRRKEGS